LFAMTGKDVRRSTSVLVRKYNLQSETPRWRLNGVGLPLFREQAPTLHAVRCLSISYSTELATGFVVARVKLHTRVHPSVTPGFNGKVQQAHTEHIRLGIDAW
jgi:hypothetical protein